jgi:putative molybdopterin biosynthesis protein
VNREPGSGVRQWLDLRLKQLGIPIERIPGYIQVVNSHAEVAKAILEGKANLGIGITAIAKKFGLDFIPLYEEPFEIAAPHSFVSDKRYAPFFEYLSSNEIHAVIRNLDGYTVPQNSGRIDEIC